MIVEFCSAPISVRCLQITQLHGGRDAAEDFGGVDQRLRGLEFGFGVNDLGAPVALGLRLLGDGAHHVLRQLDRPDLDIAHLDAPGLGLGVEDALDVGAELLALGQHLVESCCPSTARKRRLRQHGSGRKVGLHLDDRALGIDDVEVEHGVYLHLAGCRTIARWAEAPARIPVLAVMQNSEQSRGGDRFGNYSRGMAMPAGWLWENHRM